MYVEGTKTLILYEEHLALILALSSEAEASLNDI
jgi:hypothetical protein